MIYLQVPTFLRPFKDKVIWRKDTSSKVIYLTFDDGPIPEVTPLILDILDRYKIKATFFCVGENVRKHPEVYAEILKKGNRTGNHTYNHLRGFKCSVQYYVENTNKAKQLIDSRLFRPPHGQITPKKIEKLIPDYDIIMWDVITYDYNPRLTPNQVFRKVKKYTRNGSILSFHDSLKSQERTLQVLPKVIEYFSKKGYKFDIL